MSDKMGGWRVVQCFPRSWRQRLRGRPWAKYRIESGEVFPDSYGKRRWVRRDVSYSMTWIEDSWVEI